MSVEEAAELVGVTEATGYAWLKRWNSRGYEGIIPDFGGGSRPFKLTEEQKEKLKEMLKEKDSWTTIVWNEIRQTVPEGLQKGR